MEFKAYMNFSYGDKLRGLSSVLKSSEEVNRNHYSYNILLSWALKKEEISNGPGGLRIHEVYGNCFFYLSFGYDDLVKWDV